jgi:dihydrofolate reductase
MGTIAVHEFVALDGVFEDPSWTFEFGFDPLMAETLGAITATSQAILLGRTTYEMFAPAWSTRTVEDDPGAPFFNDTHKYVVGAQEPNVEWGPSTRLGAFDPEVIRRLKDDTEGVIYVSGSGTLVRGMLAEGLVDELHLFVYPVAVGKGRRLFTEDGETTRLALLGHDVYDNGVVHLAYGPPEAQR